MTRRTAPGVSALLLMFLLDLPAHAAEPVAAAPVRGNFRYTPGDDAKTNVPERYRMEGRDFAFEMKLRFEMPHAGVADGAAHRHLRARQRGVCGGTRHEGRRPGEDRG